MTASIPAFDQAAYARALAHHDRLAKPAGSLGRLEELAARYSGAHGAFPPPRPGRPTLVVFAADHGVTVEGVSAFPSAVTAAVVGNVAAGGSAINALCRSLDVDLRLVDAGVAGALPKEPQAVPIERRAIAAGTRNLAFEPAMSREQAEAALALGIDLARELHERQARLIGVGEIGIGNTTSAAALVAACTGAAPALVVGPGAGLDAAGVARKVAVVERALARSGCREGGLALLADLGGFELAAMAGLMLGAAERRVPVVLDGVVTNAAALAAVRIAPNVADYLVAAHGSTEPGARVALESLRLRPLLSLDMRLGEGSGAALGLSLLKTAVELMLEMQTLDHVIARAGLGAP